MSALSLGLLRQKYIDKTRQQISINWYRVFISEEKQRLVLHEDLVQNIQPFKQELAKVKMNQKVTYPKTAFGFVWSTYCELQVSSLLSSPYLQKKLNPHHGKIFWACRVFPHQVLFNQANIIIIPVSRIMNSHFTDQ